ncbi:MAG: signal peptide peptidase SppA [Planctomycetaceae bacterium]
MRRLFSICTVLLASTCGFLGAVAAAEEQPAESSGPVTIAHIELKGSYPEGAQLPGLFGELSESLDAAVARLDRAADDGNVLGVVLHINSPTLGPAKMRAFRQAIARVQAKGKKVYAWLDTAGNMDYALATACDEITMPEPGVLMTVGVRAEVTFYKRLFDLLGIRFDVLRVGEFKSAAEPYTRTEMSPEFRQEMQEVLDDFYRQLIDTVAQSRKLPKEKVAAAIDSAPLTARQAKELGLIDRVAYADEQEAALVKLHAGKTVKFARKYGRKKLDTDFSGLAGMMKLMEMLLGGDQPRRRTSNQKIAVIHASGMIMTGKSRADFLSGEGVMGSDTMVKAIRDARLDDTVKAIVLRVDSPGGSALASDLIWHELELVEKPFVASMGDVAGSGGYYIAMGADRIFADPGTITGSIGVVGGKLALEGLYGKVGISTDIISLGRNSGVNSSTAVFSDSERSSMQKLLIEIYNQFTAKAAQGRKMDVARLRELAGGRIYSGEKAQQLGLVDQLGSLEDAIAYAKEKAGLKADEKIERLVLPKATSPFESLLGPLDPNAVAKSPDTAARHLLAGVSPEADRHFRLLGLLRLLGREQVLALMPFDVLVK